MQQGVRGASERQQAILELLSRRGELNIADLSARFDVSEMTVRRDLGQLESAGLLRRTRGGAASAASGSFEPPFALRARTNPEAKARIAAAAAGRVLDGQTVIVDGGSTGVAVAQALAGRSITVCALNLRVADVLATDAATRVMVPGGSIRTGEGSISGPEVEQMLRQYTFDTYLMTASGFDPIRGFTEWNREDAAVKRAALASARRTIAVCDASKHGAIAFARVCALSDVDVFVTDTGLDVEAQRELASVVSELVVSGSSGVPAEGTATSP